MKKDVMTGLHSKALFQNKAKQNKTQKKNNWTTVHLRWEKCLREEARGLNLERIANSWGTKDVDIEREQVERKQNGCHVEEFLYVYDQEDCGWDRMANMSVRRENFQVLGRLQFRVISI